MTNCTISNTAPTTVSSLDGLRWFRIQYFVLLPAHFVIHLTYHIVPELPVRLS